MEKNFDNYYIDTNGEVYSFKTKRWLKLSKDSKGYKVLKRRNKPDIRVHRIVAQLYIPNIDNKNEINHKNGIKTDNRIENLEWTTHQENCKHAYKTGLHKPSEIQKEKARQFCIKTKSRRCINLQTGKIYNSTKEASRETKIPNSVICYQLNHSQHPQWKYL